VNCTCLGEETTIWGGQSSPGQEEERGFFLVFLGWGFWFFGVGGEEN